MNIRDEARTTITIEHILLDGRMKMKEDGWIEAKRLKMVADQNTLVWGLNFTRIDRELRKAIPEDLSYPSVPQWTVLRGALVVNGMVWETTDFIQNGFAFSKRIPLYAKQPSILSLDVRLLPGAFVAWLGFYLSGYACKGHARIINNEPTIEKDLILVHPLNHSSSLD